MTTVFKSTEARPMPGRSTGPVAWLRGNLFSTPSNSLMSLALLAVCLWALCLIARLGRVASRLWQQLASLQRSARRRRLLGRDLRKRPT
jgi:hypothetical protein